MKVVLLTTEIRYEPDVVLARQRARQIAGLVGFDNQEQTRIATAVSEIARNAFQYAGGGRVEFALTADLPALLAITVTDQGPGIRELQVILGGQYRSRTGMGVGMTGARRLMDRFTVETVPTGGTSVALGKLLPKGAASITAARRAQIAAELAAMPPHSPFEEVQNQNQELLRALEELRLKQVEAERLNQELAETNQGVLALYSELDDKAEALRKASEMKSRFLSNVGHEIRTPINAILSLSRLLLERADGELTPEQEKQAAYIRASAEALSELVSDLLDLARIEAGKTVIRPRDVTVQELFGALRGMFRALATSPNVALIFEEPREDIALHTDEGKLAQILRNFISNALKFTEYGEVRVSAIQDTPETICFVVRDTGIGIAREDQELIFEEFGQVENRLQKRVKGTGLGLPLTRRLTELLGGNVRVSSEVDVGSTFTARIPCLYRASSSEGANGLLQSTDPQTGADSEKEMPHA